MTYRSALATFAWYGTVCKLPRGEQASKGLGEAMKLVYVCYAALGYAVARWIFQRQPIPISDPVTRFRSSGLL